MLPLRHRVRLAWQCTSPFVTPRRNMLIVPVRVREDNYAYILKSTPKEARSQAVFVDPYDVPTVHRAAQSLGLRDEDIIGSITTHGHYDHAGGNSEFAKTFPGRPIWGGSKGIQHVTDVVRDGDSFELFGDGAKVSVKGHATPCHTRDSICFYVEDERSDAELAASPNGVRDGPSGEKKRGVFTGDTLFISGCGRFFEGDAADMDHALNGVLSKLPPDTLVYCGHEYTKSNVAFSAAILPQAPGVQQLLHDVRTQRNHGVTTGLYTLREEAAHNPFMMVRQPDVQRAMGCTDAVSTMHALRDAKNQNVPRIQI